MVTWTSLRADYIILVVPLDKFCYFDWQCLNSTVHSECDGGTESCTCVESYTPDPYGTCCK